MVVILVVSDICVLVRLVCMVCVCVKVDLIVWCLLLNRFVF